MRVVRECAQCASASHLTAPLHEAEEGACQHLLAHSTLHKHHQNQTLRYSSDTGQVTEARGELRLLTTTKQSAPPDTEQCTHLPRYCLLFRINDFVPFPS